MKRKKLILAALVAALLFVAPLHSAAQVFMLDETENPRSGTGDGLEGIWGNANVVDYEDGSYVPIGNGLWVLAAAAGLYLLVRTRKTRKAATLAVAAVALTLGTTQCRKQNQPETPTEKTIYITLKGGNGSNNAKTDVEVDSGKITWNNGDKVYVVYNGQLLGTTALTATPNPMDARQATVSGTITTTVTISETYPLFTFYYVGNGVSFTPTDRATNLTFNIATQSGTDAGEYMIGRTEAVEMELAEGAYKPKSNPTKPRTFTPLTAVLWLDTQAGFGSCQMTMSGGQTINKMEISLSNPATPAYTPGNIIFQGSNNAQISLMPTTPAGTDQTFTFSGNGKIGDVKVKNGIKAGNVYAKLCDNEAFPIPVMTQEGILPGLFSVAYKKYVRFSSGNLYYNGSWGFEANQYDFRTLYYKSKAYPSCINGVYDYYGTTLGNYGLFAFSTTASTSNWGMSLSSEDGDFKDWGLIPTLPNGANFWRTLTSGEKESTDGEWYYLTNLRTGNYNGSSANAAHLRAHARIQVSGGPRYVKGLILLPDTFTLPSGLSFNPDAIYEDEYQYMNNTYTSAQWVLLENAGAVFLPATGWLKQGSMGNIQDDGYYRSSNASIITVDFANSIFFDKEEVDIDTDRKADGNSVRLVHDVN